jgi:hypothetical protein
LQMDTGSLAHSAYASYSPAGGATWVLVRLTVRAAQLGFATRPFSATAEGVTGAGGERQHAPPRRLRGAAAMLSRKYKALWPAVTAPTAAVTPAEGNAAELAAASLSSASASTSPAALVRAPAPRFFACARSVGRGRMMAFGAQGPASRRGRVDLLGSHGRWNRACLQTNPRNDQATRFQFEYGIPLCPHSAGAPPSWVLTEGSGPRCMLRSKSCES